MISFYQSVFVENIWSLLVFFFVPHSCVGQKVYLHIQMYSVASSFKNHITFSCRLPLKALKKTTNCFWKLFSVRLNSLESFSLRNKTEQTYAQLSIIEVKLTAFSYVWLRSKVNDQWIAQSQGWMISFYQSVFVENIWSLLVFFFVPHSCVGQKVYLHIQMYSVASSFKNHITFSCRLPLKALKKTTNCFWKLFSVRLNSLESFSLRNKTFMIFDIIRRMVTTSGRTESWLVYRGKVLFVALVVFLLWCCFVNSVLEYQAICITLFLFEF